MIGLGLASSHAPMAFQVPELWDDYYYKIHRMATQPHPAAAERETMEVMQAYRRRIVAGFTALREQLRAYAPDVMVVIGGDQTEQFDASLKPAFMMYVGDEQLWGHVNPRGVQPSEETLRRYKTDGDLARRIATGLVKRGFDLNFSAEMQFLAQPQKGLPHAFTRPVSEILPDPDIPLVLVYENTYDPPSPSARRCYELGQAIAQICQDSPKKIAIYGSGGLAHDPGGPRAGFLDEPLDRWILREIAEGNGSALDAMYVPCQTMAGGTGEVRAWITVAGAMEELGSRDATVVDYVPAYKAITGLGFAYWDKVPATNGHAASTAAR